jgi:hypothetical protein
VTAPARRGPAPAGRPSIFSTSHSAANDVDGTRATGTVLRLTGDLEAVAVDLLDRIGPAACAALVVALVELLEGLR